MTRTGDALVLTPRSATRRTVAARALALTPHRATRRTVAARALALALALVLGASILGGVTVTALVLSPAPAAAQAGPPSSDPATDLRADKLRGPFLQDSSPGRAAGLPLAVAGVVIMAIVVVLIVRARRSSHKRPPQLSEGSGGQ